MRSLFSNLRRTGELLTPAASGCPARRPLTKSEEEETIIINRSARSTYPKRKSVRRSGATPIIDLGTLETGTESLGIYVNDAGQVVRFSTINTESDPVEFFGFPTHIFIWEHGDKSERLVRRGFIGARLSRI